LKDRAEARILARPVAADYTAVVATVTDVEKLALDLPENQRAVLAATC